MRVLLAHSPSLSSPPRAVSLSAVLRRHCFSSPATSHSQGLDTRRHWNKFYTRHHNKFFKDRHYLEKDWGKYFADNDCVSPSSSERVVLEVGYGAGNTIFPLVASYPNLFVHACDFSSQAIELVKSRVDYNHRQVHAFVCDVVNDDLCDAVKPSSVDVVTLVFMLSAVCPEKMPLILQNIKKVLKPKGYILVRDYAVGDYAQGELHKRNKMINDNFYVRGDGTYAFYFSEEYLSSLFTSAGFNTVHSDLYSREIHNRSHNITMYRLCHCNTKMILLTSWSDNNPGRRYHKCPNKNCSMFIWYDIAIPVKERMKDLFHSIDTLTNEVDELKRERDVLKTERDLLLVQMKEKVGILEHELVSYKLQERFSLWF